MSSSLPNKFDVVVDKIVPVTDLVKRFEFRRVDGERLPTFSGGAHTVVEMQDGTTRRLNPYSLMSDPSETGYYAISVRRDDRGRGGSLFLHTKVKEGDTLTISYPANLFSLDRSANKHLMVAGGIGITPFMSQIKQLIGQKGRLGNLGKADFELIYVARDESQAAYIGELAQEIGKSLTPMMTGDRNEIDLIPILARQPLGTHIYICGPKGMLEAARAQAAQAGWPTECVHFEEFLAPEPGEPFEVELALSGKTIQVSDKQSLLEAIEAAGVEAPYMCRGGACGQCETAVVSCDGDILHKDHWLDDEQQASNKFIMPCMSRFKGKKLVLQR